MSFKPTSVPTKNLLVSITSGSLSFRLNNIKGWDNVNLTAADFGTQGYVVFRDATRTKLEIMEFDPTTIASNDITIVRRGLSFDGDRLTETTARKLSWTKGDTFVDLGTDTPQLWRYLEDYINGIAIAGSPDASETAKGLVEEATQAQVNAGTDTGETGARLFVAPSKLTERLNNLSPNEVFTTNETLVAGQPVGISNIKGGLALSLKSAIENAHTGTLVSNMSGGNNCIAPIGGNKMVILLNSTNAAGTLYAQVITADPATNDVTLGALATVATATTDSSNGFLMTVCKLDTDKFIVFYLADASTTAIQYRIGTVSGTTISWGTAATFRTNATTVATSVSFYADQISTDKGVFCYKTAAQDGGATAFTVSGTVATAGTMVLPNANLVYNTATPVKKIGTDKFVLINCAAGNELWAQVATISGTTITFGTASRPDLTGANNSQSLAFFSVVSPATDVFVIQYTGTSSLARLVGSTVSGTNITSGSGVVISGAIGAVNGGLWAESATSLYSISGTHVWKASLGGTAITALGLVANRLTSSPTLGSVIASIMFCVTEAGIPTLHSVASTNIQSWMYGLSNNHIGFVQNTVAAGASADVALFGVDANQSALTSGTQYLIANGILTAMVDNATINTADDLHIVTALSATQIKI